MTDEQIIDAIIEREGGATYTNNPADRGGPTRWGITQATLAAWRNADVEPLDVQTLTLTEARAIYRDRYIVKPGFSLLAAPELRAVAVDCYVTHRPKVAIAMLQRALGVPDDGILGPITIQAANSKNGRIVALKMCVERLKFFGRLISGNLTDADHDGIPDNTEFAAGWINRVADQIEALA